MLTPSEPSSTPPSLDQTAYELRSSDSHVDLAKITESVKAEITRQAQDKLLAEEDLDAQILVDPNILDSRRNDPKRFLRLAKAKHAASLAMREQWGLTAEMCIEVLHKMREQPERYSLPQCIVVQVAIATILDTSSRATERRTAALDVAKMFGADRPSKIQDDPAKEDPRTVKKRADTLGIASTAELLATMKAQEPGTNGTPPEPPSGPERLE